MPIGAEAILGSAWTSWSQLSGCPSRWQCPAAVPLPWGTHWREAATLGCRGPACYGWPEWLLLFLLLGWRRQDPYPNLPSKRLAPLEKPNSSRDRCPNLGSRKVDPSNLCWTVRGDDGLPKGSLPHRAMPMPKRCRWDRTAGKGQTGAPCPIEMAATDSIPPGLEFGGGEEVEEPELKTSRVYDGRSVVLPMWRPVVWPGPLHAMHACLWAFAFTCTLLSLHLYIYIYPCTCI